MKVVKGVNSLDVSRRRFVQGVGASALAIAAAGRVALGSESAQRKVLSGTEFDLEIGS